MAKKFELIPSDKGGVFRIKALRDFGVVKKGDVGVTYDKCLKILDKLGVKRMKK